MMKYDLTEDERLERNAKMVALYKKGNTTLAKLGKQFGLTRQAVSLIFKEYEVSVTKHPALVRTEVLKYCNKELDNNETITISDVKGHCNCPITSSYISHILIKNNIPASRSEKKSLRGTLIQRLSNIETSSKSVTELLDLCRDENNYPSRMTLMRVLKKYNIPYNEGHHTYKNN